MQKTRRILLIFILVIFFGFLGCYFLIANGFVDKLVGSIENVMGTKLTAEEKNDKPVISFVVNSSGEKKVNESVVITVDVTDDYKVEKLQYSFDKENWKDVDNFGIQEFKYVGKIIFDDNMNETVYIRAINEFGNQSYYYQTKVFIDK